MPRITTLKLDKETKQRLEKLREHRRETYDEIIRKILFILNKVRVEPDKALGILEIIDEKRKRMFEEKKQIKEENQEQKKPEEKLQKKGGRKLSLKQSKT